eukprot:scaffold27105_cov32-Tisochrysis_lutea.AAC.2
MILEGNEIVVPRPARSLARTLSLTDWLAMSECITTKKSYQLLDNGRELIQEALIIRRNVSLLLCASTKSRPERRSSAHAIYRVLCQQ